MKKSLIIALALITSFAISAQKKDKKTEGDKVFDPTEINSGLVSNLSFRNIGPALISGRISDIAVNPTNSSEYYLAVASGGVWKTTNHGTTYSPIFDNEGSYSIGCITMDPNNAKVLWVGTGENNNQRSVAYGDGVYKSEDGGNSWENVGLKKSEHISKIIVDPKNSNVVYVAAYGPLWSDGGERGIYKTIDGGKTWERILFVSDNTGISDLIMDPSDNNILYASAHQRRRHVFTYIGGGKESAIHKSTDGGKTWVELKSGLPVGKMGRIGLAVSPVNSNYVYAILEAEEGKGGFFKSTDKGASWEKQSGYKTSGNYYQEIICDTRDVNKVYSMNTWLHHTEDGGKTFKKTGEKSKHVDNHCIWINPQDPNHWIVGCDGGVYETYDHAENWKWMSHLPLVQFYKVALDNDYPFYNVYGGTQDNNSVGGPSRTLNNAGILNSDWFITNGGDGFESQVDPKDPNIVYAQAQYGWLVRYDKKSGEKMGIQPMPKKGEDAFRWNWDAPLVISTHNNHRLYFAANKVFKSDDQGNTWTSISGDLTQQLNRNEMEVMGEIQKPEVVMKNKSTTIFGNIVALAESPKNEKLLYAGTDDGLIQITNDGGANWTKKASFSGVPSMTYVNMLIASQHDENVVYAAFNNHKKGDFKPYLMKSTDKGNSWMSIAGNLPERGSVYAIAEDHINSNLLFAGTEFGVFFTIDGGNNWVQLKSGLPTVAIRDIAIQQRENDLVLASFGRGFYVLDDYSTIRELTPENLNKDAFIFPIKTALEYIPSNPLGLRGRGHQGESFYLGQNPDFGATIRFYLKESPEGLKDKRKKDMEDGVVKYPSNDDFFEEDNDESAYLMFVIKDSEGNEVRKIKTGANQGLNSVNWNLRYTTTSPIKLSQSKPGRYSDADEGPLALPGEYSVEFYLCDNGSVTKMGNEQSFTVKALENSSLARQTKENVVFKKQLAELRRQFFGTSSELDNLSKRLKYIKSAVQNYPNADLAWLKEIKDLELEITKINDLMWGERHLSKRDVETLPGTGGRIETIVYQTWYSTSNPTATQKEQYSISVEEYESLKIKVLGVQNKITIIEEKMNVKGIPYTPNRENFREN
jgi:photosystem II stability/assembly factor-like uncharacterized protein